MGPVDPRRVSDGNHGRSKLIAALGLRRILPDWPTPRRRQRDSLPQRRERWDKRRMVQPSRQGPMRIWMTSSVRPPVTSFRTDISACLRSEACDLTLGSEPRACDEFTLSPPAWVCPGTQGADSRSSSPDVACRLGMSTSVEPLQLAPAELLGNAAWFSADVPSLDRLHRSVRARRAAGQSWSRIALEFRCSVGKARRLASVM